MDLDDDGVAEHIRNTPPSCIAGFRLAPAELPERFDDCFKVVYGLLCLCGNDQGAILGFPLSDLSRGYDGPDFVTPLFFKCGACGGVMRIIDSDIHGYHAEVGKLDGGVGSTKIRGKGDPRSFHCPDCSQTAFSVIVGFVYWNFDVMLDDPHLPGQEFFNVFLIYGKCRNCGRSASVASLGKL